jgi:UDP-N-acetylmuramoyl-tripeptide--D-alanyl-D-alanine ligase
MTDFLWTPAAMAEAMGAEMYGDLPAGITGISIDSRTIKPGEAYFAITGDVHDGHAFVGAALNNGAALAVVEAAQCEDFGADARLLVVDDVLDGLVALGIAARARLGCSGFCPRRARPMRRLPLSTITGACR